MVMMTQFTQKSLSKLDGVHPHLVALVKRAAEISAQPFQVIEGVRTLSRQREMVKRGASKTLRSRHLKAPNGLGHAVDLVAMVGGRVSWEEPLYHRINDAMKQASREMGISVTWGGDWKNFFDGPHFELPWGSYPGIANANDALPPQPSSAEIATLVPGTRSEDVKSLQTALNTLGATLVIDGHYGPATRAMVLKITAALFGKATDVITLSALSKLARAAQKSTSQKPTCHKNQNEDI
jgi:peptidoglycan LD-endopeptidase CwlK